MENFNLEFHKIHCEDFFKTFYSNLELRNTNEAQLEYFNYNLLIEEQRLNRYLDELKPNLYLDHRIYVDELKNIIIRLLAEKDELEKSLNKIEIITYKWDIEEEKLELLFDKLKVDFISSETSLDVFKFLFSGKVLKSVDKKIEWQMIAKNGNTNKRSITDFIDVLDLLKIISKSNNIKKVDEIKILNTLFSSIIEANLIFTTSNFITPKEKSQTRGELESIINSIL